MIFAAQLYTVRDFCADEKSVRQSLEKIAKIGYPAVQYSGVLYNDLKEFRKMCDGFGLSVTSTDIPLSMLLNETGKIAEDADILGCDYIMMGMPNPDTWDTVDHCKKLCEDISNASEELLSKYGKTFCYHNHDFEFRKMADDFVLYDYLMQNLSPCAMFMLDTYWVYYAGQHPEDYLRRLSGRVDQVHFKDMKINEAGEKSMVPVIDGVLDWKEVFAACKTAGTKYAIVEQDTCEGDPFDCLEKSYKNLINFK